MDVKPKLEQLLDLVDSCVAIEWLHSSNKNHFEQEFLEKNGFEFNNFTKLNLINILLLKIGR